MIQQNIFLLSERFFLSQGRMEKIGFRRKRKWKIKNK